MAKVSKRYAEASKLVDRSKTYSIEEAVALAKQTGKCGFDASVEVNFRLNVDPRHADQQIRGAMVLPNGTGKTQKVCVVAQGEKEKEGERILAKIRDKEYVYALAIEGKERSSEEFAQEIAQLTTYGRSDITFVIGGSLGLSPAVLKRAETKISFGRFTLPHQLMRLVLSEQIYRAFMINNGSPYHK